MKEKEKTGRSDESPKPREVKRRLKAFKKIRRKKRLEPEEVELPLQVAIIGGGVAGMEAASVLAAHRCPVSLFEARSGLAANVLNKYKLFPDFSDADQLVQTMVKALDHPLITLHKDTEIVEIIKEPDAYTLLDNKGISHTVPAVLLASGYEPFDAKRKEELGFGIYDGVINSLQLESMLKEHKVLNSLGEEPQRVVFLQCVGSRDEKVGNHYCSKICCVTAVKQAIEVRRQLPDTEVYVFYMDLRLWGQGYEELYRQSQEEYNVHFVRGRISEAASTFDGRIQIKSEDTLLGQPLKMITDLLVLMIGMEASPGTRKLGKTCGIEGPNGFVRSKSVHLEDNLSDRDGFFLAGSCKRPMHIAEAVNDGRSAALEIIKYLRK